MEQLSTTQLLAIRQILDRHLHHNVCIKSSAYEELENIINILTNSLIRK